MACCSFRDRQPLTAVICRQPADFFHEHGQQRGRAPFHPFRRLPHRYQGCLPTFAIRILPVYQDQRPGMDRLSG